MTNTERLSYINNNNLHIEAHTAILVNTANLLDNPLDPEVYVDENTTETYLILSTSNGKQLINGQYEDIVNYIDTQISLQESFISKND